jgi:hypothetical protein
MAGLLGDSWEDPRTQATLQLAAGLLGGGNFGQALGRGLEGYQGTMTAAKRQAMIDEEMTRRKQEREAEQAQLAAKQAEALRIENVVRGSLMPVSGARAIGQDAGGPTQAKAELIGQAPKLDANALLAQGVPYERVKALFEAQNLGRDEVARTAEVEGPNGQKIIQGFNKWGGRQGEGVSGYVAPQLVNQGDRQTFVKPSAGVSLGVGMSPAERDAAARGWATNALARERLIFDKAGGAETGKPQFKDGMWVMPPTGMRPGEAVSAMTPVAQKDANEALNLINQARQVIPKATGSGLGSMVDVAGRFFGSSTEGDVATGELQALEGALVAKMPKMSGPQSDKDVALYKQMAGVIGDPSIPKERKLAALDQIEKIQRRYAGPVKTDLAPMPNLPPAAQHKGRTIRDTETGRVLRSDGMTWREQ